MVLKITNVAPCILDFPSDLLLCMRNFEIQ